MNPRTLPLFAFLTLALGLWAALNYNPRPSIPVASHLPALVMQPLDGSAPITWQAKPGHVTLINFFASWCVPCLAEVPQLKQLSKTKNIDFVGVAWNDSPSALHAWIARNGNPFDAIFLDNSGRAAITVGIHGVPETYIADKTGKVRLHITGAMDQATANKLAPLLAQWRDEKVSDAPAQ